MQAQKVTTHQLDEHGNVRAARLDGYKVQAIYVCSHRCCYCGAEVAMHGTKAAVLNTPGLPRTKRMTMDHVLPASQGHPKRGNRVECCDRCQREKRDMSFLAFLMWRRGWMLR